MWTHSIRATILVAALAGLAPQPARAGIYTQFACQHPDGTPAPADRWVASSQGGGSAHLCAGTTPAGAELPSDAVPQAANGQLAWSPPSGVPVTLVGFTLRRQVALTRSVTPGTVVYRLNAPTSAYQFPDIREWCHWWMGCTSIPQSDVAVGALTGGSIAVGIECHDAPCDDQDRVYGGSSWVVVTRAAIQLRDDTEPTFSDVGGALASSQPVWGTAALSYRAADAGGGIYRQKLVVDGNTVVNEVVDPNGGKCYDAMPGWGTPYEFDYALPCAARVDGRIPFDLNRIASGTHAIAASVEDAAGNARTIYEGSITVLSDPARRVFDAQGVVGLANPLADRPGLVANGANASRDAVVEAYVRRKGRPTRATSTYPGSPVLVGRVVTATGKPVANAVVSVLERESGSRTWRATKALTTSRLGGAEYRLAPGPSREVRFAYVADSEAPSFVSSRSLTVHVRPRVSLSASPKGLRTGQRVRFSGRVSGGAIPATGLALSLQARGLDGRWLTFKTIRTTSAGRFRARYRFTATTGTVLYRFRIRVLRQGGYPFAAAYSRSVAVRVRG